MDIIHNGALYKLSFELNWIMIDISPMSSSVDKTGVKLIIFITW